MLVLKLVLAVGFLSIHIPALTAAPLQKESCAEFQASDKKMNDVYKKIVEKKKSDKAFIDKLKKSQRAWLAFRDAELEALYPAQDKSAEYGSAYTSCRCLDEKRLVDQRIAQLEMWINVPAEGEVCRGSRS